MKVLQKLGKADETKDEQFEQVVVNFRRQESEGSRLQREMKAYMSAIKGMQQASINLSQSLHEVYEPDWHGKDDVLTIGKDCDALWEDFHNKLVDSTLLNLDAYLQQFPDLKTRVAKRSRKLIDYDSARHHVETLQASGMKNDRKMMKAEDELKKAQKVFDELNVGLQDELPTLWERCSQGIMAEIKTGIFAKNVQKRLNRAQEKRNRNTTTRIQYKVLLLIHSLKKGPPVPPPPKVTPTKEVAEEQIIDLFGGEFLPAPSPSQPNERPGESLLDLDFDAFQPDESVSPIPQTAVPWDMWSANAQAAQPAADSGFVADWAADFGSMSANGDAASGVEPPAAPAAPAAPAEEMQGGAQSWHQAEGWQPGGETTTPIQDNEATATEDEVSSPDSQTNPNLHPYGADEDETGQADSGGHFVGHEDRRKSTPGLLFTNEFGEEIEDSTEVTGDKWCRSPEGSVSEYETAEEWGDGGQGGGWVSAEDEPSYEDHPSANTARLQAGGVDGVAAEQGSQQRDATDRNRNKSSEKEQREQADVASVHRDHSKSLGQGDNRVFSSQTQAGGAFDSDPFAETQAGAFAETQAGGAFDSDPFAGTQFGDKGNGFDFDPFAETSGEGGVVVTGDGRGGWDSDPFANSFPAASSGTGGPSSNTSSWQEVSGSSGLESSAIQQSSASIRGTAAEGKKDVNIPRIHKEPENSDMSEDEAANRRFGKLYQELDTEKEEDAAAPSFFADFDKMNEVNSESAEAHEASETPTAGPAEPAEEQDKPPSAPTGGEEDELPPAPAEEEPGPPSVGEEVEEPPAPAAGEVMEEPGAPPAGGEDKETTSDSPKEEKPALTVGSPSSDNAELGQIPPAEDPKTSPGEAAPAENMPIPSVVIEPASSNEGDDDRDADIISPTTISDNGMATETQAMKHMSPSGGVSGLPDDFLYKVETMHDFEAANSDELELKRGDVVLVVPTASVEDQDAGWLTGIKESDWLTLGVGAQKGLFPDNFTQRLE
ncbi:amphiphysin [Stegastes partitus]|uniref:Amphiphysin n=1 Tax=Stegastes partitus TaxID=144197 RepID=A0A9Y4NRC7_9TELE|nr:PREDICTED: amphiphysin [Stegastes partitus]